MWPIPQFPADFVNSLKKSFMENFIFCAVMIVMITIENNKM